jgi:hypothetical protein
MPQAGRHPKTRSHEELAHHHSCQKCWQSLKKFIIFSAVENNHQNVLTHEACHRAESSTGMTCRLMQLLFRVAHLIGAFAGTGLPGVAGKFAVKIFAAGVAQSVA